MNQNFTENNCNRTSKNYLHSHIHAASLLSCISLDTDIFVVMDIFESSKSLSEREESHLDGTASFNQHRRRGDLSSRDDLVLLPQNYVTPPILAPQSLLSFPIQHENFVNIPGFKLKPRTNLSRAWSSSVVSRRRTLKENSPLCMPLDLDDCHTESDYFSIKAVGSNTESTLELSEPPLKKSKIALEEPPQPFKNKKRRAHLRPRGQSHQASEDTNEESARAQHYSAFLPFEHMIPNQHIEEAAPKEHGHKDILLHADRSFLFNKDQVDDFRSPEKTHKPKDRAEPILLWDTPRSVLSFPKPHATRGHDTPYRRQQFLDDASSMSNHHKECRTKVLSQSPWSAFCPTMRCDP